MAIKRKVSLNFQVAPMVKSAENKLSDAHAHKAPVYNSETSWKETASTVQDPDLFNIEADSEDAFSESEESVYSGLGSEIDSEESDAEDEPPKSLSSESAPQQPLPEIEPVTESDSDSEDEIHSRNPVGRIPMAWYNDYPHIGYDLEGARIEKPAAGNELDEFLKKMDDPKYWRTFKDEKTGKDVVLDDQELEMIQRIQQGSFPDTHYNPHQDSVDFFTHEKMIHPISDRPEPKSRFVPSKWEHKRIMKIVKAIRNGWIQPPKVKKPDFYLLWNDDDQPHKDHPMHIAAPKMKLPGHEESYNPPEEYLLTPQELEAWKKKDPQDRPLSFIPQKFSNLRSVPGYGRFITERFERCLDLYLCPRARKMRMNVDPESLIPVLPKPKDLQPFPTSLVLKYKGHQDVVRAMSLHPNGQLLASGANDKTVRIWEVATGRCLKVITFEHSVVSLEWNPLPALDLLLVASGDAVHLISARLGSKDSVEQTQLTLQQCREAHLSAASSASASSMDWSFTSPEVYQSQGVFLTLKHSCSVQQVNWHHKGDYFSSLCGNSSASSVFIHQLLKCRSQTPFKKSIGLIQRVLFHPSKPFFFVSTQTYVRIYNLVQQELVKKLITGMKWISSMDIHPQGDNLILGSYDKKLCWFDLDLSVKPYKVLRYHKMALRQVAYHKKLPLFASCSDDGNIHVFHGMVYNDLLQNPLIVPVKVLKGHSVVGKLGVMDCVFHHSQPWLFSAGADKTIHLYT